MPLNHGDSGLSEGYWGAVLGPWDQEHRPAVEGHPPEVGCLAPALAPGWTQLQI